MKPSIHQKYLLLKKTNLNQARVLDVPLISYMRNNGICEHIFHMCAEVINDEVIKEVIKEVINAEVINAEVINAEVINAGVINAEVIIDEVIIA